MRREAWLALTLLVSGLMPIGGIPLAAKEWILDRSASHSPLSWPRLVESTSEALRFRRSLGPEGRFALVEGTLPAQLPPGLRAQPNYRYRALDGLDPDYESSWGLHNFGQASPNESGGTPGVDIGIESAWKLSVGSHSEIVAILDTGIDLDHEDLQGNLWINPREVAGNGVDDDQNGFVDDVRGWNFVAGSDDPQDDNNHGTFCAGIIGARSGNHLGSRGVNQEVSLMPVKVLDQDGVGSSARAIDGITYAVKNGAGVINASWGGPVYDEALESTIAWAGAQGVLFVAAAGNFARDNDTDPGRTYPASFPIESIVSVAAYDRRDALARFSSFGKETVHLGAPGVDIFSTLIGGYGWGDGTSFAAPFVSGVAALVKAYVPGLGVAALKDRLLATSEVIDYYQKERTASAGRVHAYHALADIRPARPRLPDDWVARAESQGTAHPYADRTAQVFRFERPGATHIRVHFKGFDTELGNDTVVMEDGKGTTIVTYSGKLGDFWSADALGDTLVLKFTSDYSVDGFGFDVDASDASTEEVIGMR